MPDCSSIQKSLAWCQGKPQFSGIRSRLYFTARSNIVQWPELPKDRYGRPTSAIYDGAFVLKADAEWLYMDILPEKSQLTSDTQGEFPGQSQLNKLVAVHPGVEMEAAEAAAWFNNNETVFLVQDVQGNFRVVGHKDYPIKVTVAQDNGQGPAGATATTITVEAVDDVPAPFYLYSGVNMTESGLSVQVDASSPSVLTQI